MFYPHSLLPLLPPLYQLSIDYTKTHTYHTFYTPQPAPGHDSSQRLPMRGKAAAGQAKKKGNQNSAKAVHDNVSANGTGPVQSGGNSNTNSNSNIALNGRNDFFHVSYINANDTNVEQAYHLLDKVAVYSGMYVCDQLDVVMEAVLFAYSFTHLLVQNYNVYRTHYLEVDYCAFIFSLLALTRRVVWKLVQHHYHNYLIYVTSAPASFIPVVYLNHTAQMFAYSPSTNFNANPMSCGVNSGGGNGDNNVFQSGVNGRNGGLFSRLFNREHAAAEHPTKVFERKKTAAFHNFAVSSVLFLIVIALSIYFGVALATRTNRQYGKILLLLTPIMLYWTSTDRLAKCLPEKCVFLTSKGDQNANKTSNSTVLFVSGKSFSLTMKNILYASITNALYVGLFPVVFVSSDHLYWHAHRTRLLVVVVFINTILLLSSRLMALRVHELLTTVHTYGCWRYVPREGKENNLPSDPKEVAVWKPGVLYKRGAVVRFHPGLVPSAAKADSSSVKVWSKSSKNAMKNANKHL